MTEERVSEEQFSRARFIRLGAALGVGAASASVLAACGGGSAESGGNGSGGNESGSGSEQPAPETTQASEQAEGGGGSGQAANAIASEADVPPGSAATFEESGQPAVLVHLDSGDFVAYSAVCTHQQCTVAYQDGQLACPCHGSLFDPADGGAVINGPAQTPLPEIPVEVQDGQVVRA